MRKILGIARYTFIEIFRNKVYYVLLLFAAILIFASLLLGSLGGEQRSRMITDFGLASIETLSLITAIFAAVTLVLEEMESRTLYLTLTRPVARHQFIIGRFLGLVTILSCTFVLMSIAHAGLLYGVGASIDHHYFLSLVFSWEKIVVIAAVAILFSLFSTSTVSAVSFTLFFWILGHFSDEILFLARRSSQPVLFVLCKLFYYLAPNFQAMNLRDLPTDLATGAWAWAAFGYGLSYTLMCLFLTSLLFRKKEF